MNGSRLSARNQAWKRAWRAAWAVCACLTALFTSQAYADNPANMDLRVSFQGIAMIPDLQASPTPALGQIRLRWTTPSYDGVTLPVSYSIKVSSVGNIQDPAAFTAAQPLSDFSSTSPPAVGTAGATQTMIVRGLTLGATYCFAIETIDASTPTQTGLWLRSVERSYNLNNCSMPGTGKLPLAPFGIGLQVLSTSTVRLNWLPVTANSDGTPFANPSAPKADELTDYQVLRATAVVQAPWTNLVTLSTSTLRYDDTASAFNYYCVVANNNVGTSEFSNIRGVSTKSNYAVAPDSASVLEVPLALLDPLLGDGATPESAYRIDASSHPEDIGGRVFKSVEFIAHKGPVLASSDFVLNGMGLLKLHYMQEGSLVVPSGNRAGIAPAVVPTPDQISVYWHNGVKYIQLYGKVDRVNQDLIIETKYVGRYQLRSVERVGSFNFDTAGMSNRLLTPNADGKNDSIVFTFDNPKGSAVTGKIFDLKGAEVATMVPGPVSESLMWDGKAGGRVVPGGVYIYQIQAEGRNFNGTIVVIR